ncbi:sensor histidine kinase [Bacillus alveayuensis]|jgi:two-component system, NarL family, sensor histidine kinase DegS|uniref:sensor histidine kinase n=1 Tax=Aeribacillus alveayuensis TaxID=279215 RepID=UPI0005D10443|nr:sensor histidine kinase [Bacillus alveayuensis]
MDSKNFDAKILDQILEKMIRTVQTSKDEIFKIGESSRQEYDIIVQELKLIKEQVNTVIEKSDKLAVQSKYARQRLVEVSKNFQNFSEEDIRTAYERAHSLQMELTMLKEKEKQLRDRRDELERRLLNLKEMMERADHLVGQINVVLHYLDQDLRKMGDILEDARQKQLFGLRIIEAQEEERKRLSREIHDGPAQLLANVLMRSDLIDRVFRQRGAEEGFKEVKNLREMVRGALYEVRRIIYDLRPMALDDLGLIPTLRKYLATIEEYNGRTKISFTSIGTSEENRLPARFEVALFRLVQEAVTNALKHSEGDKIDVKVEVRKDQINLLIRDNGKGFDPHQIDNENRHSFGLIGMKERVDLLDGKLVIHSKQGQGTSIMIQVPINMQKSEKRHIDSHMSN